MQPIKLIRAKKPDMPKLLVQLYGPSGSGKTLLASKMPGSKLVFDADGRFMDQASEDDEIYFAYETAAENMKITNITAALSQTVAGSDIANIIIDTMTTPFQDLIDSVEKMTGRPAKTHKASVMKGLRRELFGYNKNVLVIFHTHVHGDGMSSNTTEGKTLSDIELGRFDMFTNMTLKVMIDQNTGQRGVLVERNRFGHSGITVWDDTGRWDGFWEKLQAEVYKGLTRADMDKIASSTPTTFADKAAAWAWGMEQGCFNDVLHAKNAMAEMESTTEIAPDELWGAWVVEVQRRVAEKKALLATVTGAVDALYTGKLKAPNRRSFTEWLIARYTTSRTPDNVRWQESELSADETAQIVAALNSRSDFYLSEFAKTAQPTATPY